MLSLATPTVDVLPGVVLVAETPLLTLLEELVVEVELVVVEARWRASSSAVTSSGGAVAAPTMRDPRGFMPGILTVVH